MIAILPKGLDKLLYEKLSKKGISQKGLVELYHISNGYMKWSSDDWNVCTTFCSGPNVCHKIH